MPEWVACQPSLVDCQLAPLTQLELAARAMSASSPALQEVPLPRLSRRQPKALFLAVYGSQECCLGLDSSWQRGRCLVGSTPSLPRATPGAARGRLQLPTGSPSQTQTLAWPLASWHSLARAGLACAALPSSWPVSASLSMVSSRPSPWLPGPCPPLLTPRRWFQDPPTKALAVGYRLGILEVPTDDMLLLQAR